MTVQEPGATTATPPANPSIEVAEEREQSYRGGLVIFLISESMFFVSLLATRFVLAGDGHPAQLDQVLAAVLTILMLLSLFPATLMQRAARHANWDGVRTWAATTLGAGLVVLAGVMWEWATGDISAQSRFGGIYYLTVAMHTLHILIGLLLLVAVITRVRSGKFTRTSHFGVEAGQLFWYLVVGLWVAVWAVLYLV